MRRRRRRIAATIVAVAAVLLAGIPGASARPEVQSAETINVVAIGDSIGFGLWDLQGGYARRYVTLLEDQGHHVDFTNLSVPGWETDDLLEALDWSLFREILGDADIVVGAIGGNDLDRLRTDYLDACTPDVAPDPPDVSGVKRNAGAIAAQVTTLAADAQVLTFTLYNPYVDQDRPTRCGGESALKVLNGALLDYNRAVLNSSLTSADVYAEFNLRFGSRLVDPARKWYLAFDDFHPNFRGHQKIAELLVEKTTLP